MSFNTWHAIGMYNHLAPRNVDFIKEVGDRHARLGRTYRSKDDYAAAIGKYRECLAYLQQHGLSDKLPSSAKENYAKLRDTELPRLIRNTEAAIK